MINGNGPERDKNVVDLKAVRNKVKSDQKKKKYEGAIGKYKPYIQIAVILILGLYFMQRCQGA